ncbi:MAG: ABC transporter substrate-binding protein [Pseudonocardiaceae bacterium]
MATLLLDRPAPPADDATRREFLISGLSLTALLTGCGGRHTDAPREDTAGGGRFPVTIDHKYGSTEIPAEPQRVVTVGFTDHDAVLALGVAPVAVGTDDDGYSAGQPNGIWPWAQQQLGDAMPEQLSYQELNVEAIAALQPDLILGLSSGMTEQEYRLLSRIAPTVAQSGDYPDFFMPWQALTRSAGRALGRTQRAEQLYFVESSASPRVSILTELGFTVPPEIDRLAGELTYAEISAEQLSLLDRDVIVWDVSDTPEARSTIEGNPLYQLLRVAREGRGVFVEERVLAAAMVLISVLSLPVVIDRIVPMLAAAVDGDPTTEVPS